jgi:hypothetical protein
METIRYKIVDEHDRERFTESMTEAKKAFRAGYTVLTVKEVQIYTEDSIIVVTVYTEMK